MGESGGGAQEELPGPDVVQGLLDPSRAEEAAGTGSALVGRAVLAS